MRDGINILAASGVKRSALDEIILTRRLTEDQRDAAWEVGHRKYEQKLGRAKTQQAKARCSIRLREHRK